MDSKYFYDVIVIGGGISGISTIYHLISSSASRATNSTRASNPTRGDNKQTRVCLLEARARWGGRISGYELSSKHVELGANWIHGILGNPLYELSLKHGLVNPLNGPDYNPATESVSSSRYFVCGLTCKGEKVPLRILQQVYERYFWFMKICESYHLDQDKDPKSIFKNSLGEHLKNDIESYLKDLNVDKKKSSQAQNLSSGQNLSSSGNDKDQVRDGDQVGDKDLDQDKKIRRAIFKTLLLRENCITGSHSIFDVNLKDFGAYEELPGGNLTLEGGFGRLIEILLDEIDNKIKSADKKSQSFTFDPYLDHQVTKIKWKDTKSDSSSKTGSSSSSNLNSSKSSPSLVTIECSNGQKFFCNHVVVTLPLGVLKADVDNNQTSDKDQSSDKDQTSDKDQDKRSLFDPPLPDYKIQSIKNLGFGIVDKIFLEWRNKLPIEILDPHFANEYILIWDDDEQDNDDQGDKKDYNLDKDQDINLWYKTIYSLTMVSDRCLMAWLSGKQAVHVENLEPQVVGDTLRKKVLQKFFHPSFPSPDFVLVTKWSRDQLSRGSYSYLTPRSNLDDIEKLGQPIYSDPGNEKPTIVFAGEACHPSFFSTTHGAFLSGKKAATFLLDTD